MRKSQRLNIFLTEFLPPIIMAVISIIIYIILKVTKASFAAPEQAFLYMIICFIPCFLYIVTAGYLRLPLALKIGLYGYFFCSNLLATTFNIYTYVPFFDTILHTAFGYLCGYLLIYILSLFGDYSKLSFCMKVLITLFFTAGIGAFWEVAEYTVDILTYANSQHEIETGLLDTMQDTFCNLCGACLFALHQVLDHFLFKDKYFKGARKLLEPIRKNKHEQEEKELEEERVISDEEK